MTPVSGMDILKATLEANKDTIVVVMTGNPSVTSSIEALRAGGWDYLPKPFSASHLQVLVGRAAHAVMVARETQDLRAQLLKQNGNSDKITLLGVSALYLGAMPLSIASYGRVKRRRAIPAGPGAGDGPILPAAGSAR